MIDLTERNVGSRIFYFELCSKSKKKGQLKYFLNEGILGFDLNTVDSLILFLWYH